MNKTKTFDEIFRESLKDSLGNIYYLDIDYVEVGGEAYYRLDNSLDYDDKSDLYIKEGDVVGDNLYDVLGLAQPNTIAESYEPSETFENTVASNTVLDLSTLLTPSSISVTYQILTSRYGESEITNNSTLKFVSKLLLVMYQYAPTWERKLGIQATLRSLSEDDLRVGSRIISTHAYNPSDVPEAPNVVDEEIVTVNDQNVNKNKKSKMDAYGMLWTLLTNDVTEDYIRRFKNLFRTVLSNDWYDDAFSTI